MSLFLFLEEVEMEFIVLFLFFLFLLYFFLPLCLPSVFPPQNGRTCEKEKNKKESIVFVFFLCATKRKKNEREKVLTIFFTRSVMGKT